MVLRMSLTRLMPMEMPVMPLKTLKTFCCL